MCVIAQSTYVTLLSFKRHSKISLACISSVQKNPKLVLKMLVQTVSCLNPHYVKGIYRK